MEGHFCHFFKKYFTYTADKNRSIAEAVAIKKKKIIFVGSGADGDSLIDDKTEVINPEGKLLLPVFIDSHMHPAMSAILLFDDVDLTNVATHKDYLTKIRY